MGRFLVNFWSVSVKNDYQKPGDHPNFRKNALGVKGPFSELSESSGVFSEQLSELEIPFPGIRNSILGMASHDLINTKPTILGATLGAIPGIAANPHEIFTFDPAFSERFFRNWGGPRAQETKTDQKPTENRLKTDPPQDPDRCLPLRRGGSVAETKVLRTGNELFVGVSRGNTIRGNRTERF